MIGNYIKYRSTVDTSNLFSADIKSVLTYVDKGAGYNALDEDRLRYYVVTGRHIPEDLYKDLIREVKKHTDIEAAECSDKDASININVLLYKGRYPKHTDDTHYTGILYLTDVNEETGGRLIIHSHRDVYVNASAGEIVIIKGSQPHSVEEVRNNIRVSVPFIIEIEGNSYPRTEGLNDYLFDGQKTELYDLVADKYDDYYTDILSHFENGRVAEMLAPHLYKRDVVDLGCGTGLLLDMCGSIIERSKYLGMDISSKMVLHALFNHPEYTFVVEDACLISIDPSKLYVSLFGSPSYFSTEFLTYLRDSGADYFLMFCREGYSSRVLGENGVVFSSAGYDVFGGGVDYSNYVIVSNIWKP